MKKLNLLLSVAAGLIGGVLSHYVWIQPVQAQAQNAAPKEVRAQSFVLVNDKDEVRGVLTFDESKDGPTSIKLFDSKRREIWSVGGSPLHRIGDASAQN